jgi:hypothetical protein
MIQSDHDRGRYSPIAFGRTEFVPGNISHPDLFCPSYERVRQLLKAKHRTATGGSSTPLGAGSETEVAYRNAGRSVFCRRENRMGTIELWNSTRSCEICCPRALQPSCRRSCSRPADINPPTAEFHDSLAEGSANRTNQSVATGVWKTRQYSPAYLQKILVANRVDKKGMRDNVIRDGLGGTGVGVHHSSAVGTIPPRLEPIKGIRAPVTAVVDLSQSGSNAARLRLLDPT